MSGNVDFLTARLHGRRGGMAEGARLSACARLGQLSELGRARLSGSVPQTASAMQHRWVQELVDELRGMSALLNESGARLIEWLLVRFQVENFKVLLRGVQHRVAPQEVQRFLLRLPRHLHLDPSDLTAAESIEAWFARLPAVLRRSTSNAAKRPDADHADAFYREAGLDRGYFVELLKRADDAIPADERHVGRPVLAQEVDVFHLQLIGRGRFLFHLEPERLASMHVRGTPLSRGIFRAMLNDTEFATAIGRVVGRVVAARPASPPRGALDVEIAAMEALAWDEYRRLANRAFRWSPIGLSAVLGYVGLRRLEIANLITLSEGIRLQIPAETLEARLIPRIQRETVHV